MLNKILKKIRWTFNPPKLDDVSKNKYLIEASQISDKIKDILNLKSETEIISLGENCNSAWYIKKVGLKNCSYPFDWTYSSPSIIENCIRDSFNKFLDKKFIFPTRSGNSAGHSFYHNNLFNHKNPLKNEVDYTYYQRCIKRFMNILKSKKSILFVMTVITEIDKRSGAGWAKGFNEQFTLPMNQNIDDMTDLIKVIRAINPNCKFLFIEQYTESDPKINLIDFKNDDYVWIMHHSFQRNTGVFFKDKTDDKVATILFSSLKV